ncbi:uncharacterized protein [Diadema antillarum]|uniref:uncharacterized protein n=1 Tax=Diadema antillarum TaxID=105358 RepID=UPI003A866181
MTSPLESDSEDSRFSSSSPESDGDVDDSAENDGIQPYRFEPEASSSDAEEAEEGDGIHGVDAESRLGNCHWCSCSGQCQAMPTLRESVCCKEVARVVETMDDVTNELDGEETDPLDCITAHPGFSPVCLNRWVLKTAYHQYRQQYGDQERVDASINQRNRHVAYRQMVRWIWGYLGKDIRVPLPSCAVVQIREAFPSKEYRGFQEI